MNFYEQTSSCVSRLSPTEQNLFNYIIKNLHIVKDMSIRDLSENVLSPRHRFSVW